MAETMTGWLAVSLPAGGAAALQSQAIAATHCSIQTPVTRVVARSPKQGESAAAGLRAAVRVITSPRAPQPIRVVGGQGIGMRRGAACVGWWRA
jgi:hypothetical protein